jgi:NADPH-dependent glutamate synthase beta subunit-like oxidoreductase/ferredoxin
MNVHLDACLDFPLFIPRSRIGTEINETGSWRFLRPIYDEKTAPCSRSCPAGEDIARVELIAAQGMFQKAWETILMENPFPAVCGRVCFHPCEESCNRARFDQPISIHRLERFLGDTFIRRKNKPALTMRAPTGKRVAVAGAGPAGLSAAYFLTRLGYRAVVFEAKSGPGGVLRWGIPRYRLPPEVLFKEIERLIDFGVEIRVGERFSPDSLSDPGDEFQAVFMGCGYGRSIPLNIPGGELAEDGLDFLEKLRTADEAARENSGGALPFIAGTAAVIGGGNTAVDVARSVIRLGGRAVFVYRRRREDMPAFEHEATSALAEGAELIECLSPLRIEEKDGRLRLTLQRMKRSDAPSDFDDARERFVPDGDLTETMEVDRVFTAIGAEAAENRYIPPKSEAGYHHFSHTVLQEGEVPVLFGGDLTTPVKSVADAVASGKQAAMAIDTYLTDGPAAVQPRLSACRVGDGDALSMEVYMEGKRRERNTRVVGFSEINTDYFTHADKITPEILAPGESAKTFAEVESTFTFADAVEEAGRCFNCGVCNDCDNCRLYCPEIAVELKQNRRRILLDYCKGCGICVVECPRNAMTLTEETP